MHDSSQDGLSFIKMSLTDELCSSWMRNACFCQFHLQQCSSILKGDQGVLFSKGAANIHCIFVRLVLTQYCNLRLLMIPGPGPELCDKSDLIGKSCTAKKKCFYSIPAKEMLFTSRCVDCRNFALPCTANEAICKWACYPNITLPCRQVR